jgi:Raf kinase inhibitor-like YbhB/YbcL family protein
MMRAILAFVLALSLSDASGAGAADQPVIQLASPAFQSGGPMPARYSARGGNHSPPLTWKPIAGARSYVLILRDPDAPLGAFTHWLVWNIPGQAARLPEDGLSGAVQGLNDAGGIGYFGPQPPSGLHHYHFQLIALDASLPLSAGAGLQKLEAAMRGHELGRSELVGTFRK